MERQIRYNVGKLPVAYRTEPDGRWASLISAAVRCPQMLRMHNANAARAARDAAAVPCGGYHAASAAVAFALALRVHLSSNVLFICAQASTF